MIVPLLIGNTPYLTTEAIDVRSPWSGDVIHRVGLGDAAAFESAAAAAFAAAPVMRAMPPFARADLLLKIAAAVLARRDEFAKLIVAEAGKPIDLASAEIDRAVNVFTAAADEARRFHGDVLDAQAFASGAGCFAMSQRVPAGVVYAMSPFNFPVNLVAHKLAPAIAAGCPVVLKPSPRTPLCAIRLAELIASCGAPAGAVNVVTCPNEIALRLCEDDRITVVSFTGSDVVGWKVKAAANRKKVTLELGGNAAVVVHDDADWAAAVKPIAAGAFGYAGQSCISVQRILVQRAIYEPFKAALVDHTRGHVIAGDPAKAGVLLGPMIDAASRDRTLLQIESAVAAGATLLTGGTADGNVIEPAILENVPTDHPLWAAEAFAPVAVLMPYDTFDDAITLVNDSAYALQAGVYTRDLGRAMRAFERLQVGGVLINSPPTFRLDNLPYGGPKRSGFGREGVRSAMEEMTELRTLIVRG